MTILKVFTSLTCQDIIKCSFAILGIYVKVEKTRYHGLICQMENPSCPMRPTVIYFDYLEDKILFRLLNPPNIYYSERDYLDSFNTTKKFLKDTIKRLT